MTKAQAARILAELKAAWPRQNVGADTISVYAEMLKDLDFQEAQRATRRLIASSKWFPTVSEIRAEAARVETDALPSAEEAWGLVMRAVSVVGAYRTPDLPPAVQRAVDAVTWRAICLDENVMSTRARFCNAYNTQLERATRESRLGEHALPQPELPTRSGAPQRLASALRLPALDKKIPAGEG